MLRAMLFRSCAGGALVLTALAVPSGPAAAPSPAKPAKAKKANRLARESSPYLLQHAHNPVDWFPWGPEAFAKAKKEGKLVFLSIGYSSCHWCHIMEKESFANEGVAKLLNKHFVCIKVDREERPDVDNIYMTALNVLGNRGGWPLSMFLDAKGRPIVGGTYWPRKDREVEGGTITGFETVLTLMRKLHKEEPKRLAEQAEKVAKATAAALAGGRGVALLELDRKLVDGVTESLGEEFDKIHGGFGNPGKRFRGPKFPVPSYLIFLQGEAKRSKSKEAARMVEVTLDRMARGGIYDHLGGGFHRYSTERTWTVPHFEKMLYDNAQLLEVYAEAYQRSREPAYRRVLTQTSDYVAREMTSPEGAFYSALDADSEGEEGRFYVWTAKQLADVITDKADLKLFRKVYGAEDGYNFEGHYHIFRLAAPLDVLAKELKTTEEKLQGRLDGMRKKLVDVRAKRPRPFLDTKVLTAWNGQMIAGLARAGKALRDEKAIARAGRAADFLLKKMRNKEGRLSRSYAAAPGGKPEARLNAYLDDYAYLVHGLLALHDVTAQKRWLAEAKALTDTMVKFHGDEARGGFYYTSSDHERLFARAKDQYDGAQPSGNSAAAGNLVRLWVKTGDARYRALAEKTFKALAPALKTNPSSLTGLAEALALWLELKGKK
jgi:uncharacterized protein YyaL (SSP411 family)